MIGIWGCWFLNSILDALTPLRDGPHVLLWLGQYCALQSLDSMDAVTKPAGTDLRRLWSVLYWAGSTGRHRFALAPTLGLMAAQVVGLSPSKTGLLH